MKTETILIGQRVKASEYAIRPKRDYWLSCGRSDMKSAAKAALDAETAKRGTIIEEKSGQFGSSLVVQWDDGSNSNCLSYMVEVLP